MKEIEDVQYPQLQALEREKAENGTYYQVITKNIVKV